MYDEIAFLSNARTYLDVEMWNLDNYKLTVELEVCVCITALGKWTEHNQRCIPQPLNCHRWNMTSHLDMSWYCFAVINTLPSPPIDDI